MRIVRFLAAVAALSCPLVAMPSSAQTVTLAERPWPFDRTLAIASDVDMQVPAFTTRIHNTMTYDFGLSFGDSIWVDANSGFQGMSIFAGPDFRDKPETESPLFWDIIDRWHDGDIDHFHSWTAAGAPNIVYAFEPSVEILQGGSEIDIPSDPTDGQFNPTSYDTLVFEVTGLGREVVSVDVFVDDEWVNIRSDSIEVYSPKTTSSSFISVDLAMTEPARGRTFDIGKIRLRNGQCEARSVCDLTVQSITLSEFSRGKVLWQRQLLHRAEITPGFATSHGGSTGWNSFFHPCFDERHPQAVLNAYHNSPNVQTDVQLSANQVDHPAYHVDLLRQHGVVYAWSLEYSLRDFSEFEPGFCYDAASDVVYFDRTTIKFPTPDAAGVSETVRSFGFEPLTEPYCGQSCFSSQGDMLDLLIQLGVLSPSDRRDYFFYTHFGSGDGSGFIRETPHLHSVESFLLASQSYYGYGPRELNRVWVVPSLAWLNYHFLHQQIGASDTAVTYDGEAIHIAALANETFSRQDFYGISFELDDPDFANLVYYDDAPFEWVYSTVGRKDGQDKVFTTILTDFGAVELLSPWHSIQSRENVTVESGETELVLSLEDGSRKGSACVAHSGTSLSNVANFLLKLRLDDGLKVDIDLAFAGGDRFLLTNHRNDADISFIDLRDVIPSRDGLFSRYAIPVYAASMRGQMDLQVGGLFSGTEEQSATFEASRALIPVGPLSEICITLEGEPGAEMAIERLAAGRYPSARDLDETKHLLAGAIVSVGSADEEKRPYALGLTHRDGGFDAVATLDQDNRFLASPVPTGRYQVAALFEDGSACHFFEMQTAGVQWPYYVARSDGGMILDLARCTPAPWPQATAASAEQAPVEEASVEIEEADDEGAQPERVVERSVETPPPEPNEVLTAETDTTAKFSFDDLEANFILGDITDQSLSGVLDISLLPADNGPDDLCILATDTIVSLEKTAPQWRDAYELQAASALTFEVINILERDEYAAATKVEAIALARVQDGTSTVQWDPALEHCAQ